MPLPSWSILHLGLQGLPSPGLLPALTSPPRLWGLCHWSSMLEPTHITLERSWPKSLFVSDTWEISFSGLPQSTHFPTHSPVTLRVSYPSWCPSPDASLAPPLDPICMMFCQFFVPDQMFPLFLSLRTPSLHPFDSPAASYTASRDGKRRESCLGWEGGDLCIPVTDSCWCMAKKKITIL